MGKTLIERLKKGAASIGLAGALALGGSGCIGPMYSAMGAGMTAQGNKFGPAYSALGDGMTRLEAAEEGRSQTNITLHYGNDSQPQIREPQRQERPLIYTSVGNTKEEIYNYPEDNPREIGRKVFYSGEWIGITGSKDIWKMGNKVTNETFYLNTGHGGGIIDKETARGGNIRCPISADIALERGGEGEFENRWYVDGKLIGSVRFIVLKRR